MGCYESSTQFPVLLQTALNLVNHAPVFGPLTPAIRKGIASHHYFWALSIAALQHVSTIVMIHANDLFEAMLKRLQSGGKKAGSGLHMEAVMVCQPEFESIRSSAEPELSSRPIHKWLLGDNRVHKKGIPYILAGSESPPFHSGHPCG
jgi:hypothetical protein